MHVRGACLAAARAPCSPSRGRRSGTGLIGAMLLPAQPRNDTSRMETFKRWEPVQGIEWPCAGVEISNVTDGLTMRLEFSKVVGGAHRDLLLRFPWGCVVAFPRRALTRRCRMPDPFILDIWRFVRGDTEPREFEQWLYARTNELENCLGAQKALDVLSADYGASAAVADVRKILRAFAEQASSSLPCRCVTLANVAVVEMGSAGDEVLGTIEERRSRGEPWWWLWCGECSRCGQWWLVGQEERQNDFFCLRRLDADEVNDLLQNNVWPSDFDSYESLLRLGHDAGVMFRFADPEQASSLQWTIVDLAKAKPGIRVAELASLLNLEPDTARMLAERAIRDNGVTIQLD